MNSSEKQKQIRRVDKKVSEINSSEIGRLPKILNFHFFEKLQNLQKGDPENNLDRRYPDIGALSGM